MKKRFIIVFAVLFLAATTQAQTQPVTDTLAYLKSFEARKTEFIGQPFSKLFNELKINTVLVSPIYTNPSDIKQETKTVIRFKRPIESQDYHDFPRITIWWRYYVDLEQSIAIANQTDVFGKWSDSAMQHYQNFIIDDIEIDGKNPPPDPKRTVSSCKHKKAKNQKVVGNKK